MANAARPRCSRTWGKPPRVGFPKKPARAPNSPGLPVEVTGTATATRVATSVTGRRPGRPENQCGARTARMPTRVRLPVVAFHARWTDGLSPADAPGEDREADVPTYRMVYSWV